MDDHSAGQQLEFKQQFRQQVLRLRDFSGTDFNSALFFDVTFQRCRFSSGRLDGVKVYGATQLEHCELDRVDLRATTLASNAIHAVGCTFTRCNFKRKLFKACVFEDCVFQDCNFTGVNFNDSRFRRCRFIGKLSDVTFNGIYDTQACPEACLEQVDFSLAHLGDYVSFYNCALDSCTPPAGTRFDALHVSTHPVGFPVLGSCARAEA